MEKRFVFVLGIAVMLCSVALAAGPFYVNAARPDDTGDGLSWATAKKTVGAAFALIDTIDPADTVYIAGGTYRTIYGGSAFTPAGNVSVYGGYNSASPYNRNVDLYETILSGDCNGNDVDIDVISDPCWNPMGYAETTGQPREENTMVLNLSSKTAIIDGLTIRNAKGGATSCSSANVTFENCYFAQNYSSGANGCIGASNSTGGSSLKVYNCTFVNNSAGTRGIIVYTRYAGHILDMQNCVISKTLGIDTSAALYLRDMGSQTNSVSNSVFSQCHMRDNVGGCAGIMVSWSTGTYTYPTVLNVSNTLFYDCQSHDHGAAMYMVTRSAAYHEYTANYTNCLITGCNATSDAQTDIAMFTGIYNTTPTRKADMNIVNCTIMNNTPSAQGAVGGQMDASGSTQNINLKNTIMWGNAGGTPANNKAQILIDTTAGANTQIVVTANYCCLDTSDPNDFGYNRSLGTNNVFANPSVDSAFFLTSGSNCKNTGNSSYTSTTTDLAGKPRKSGTIDIGAYEYYQAGDIVAAASSSKVNLVDFEAMSAKWLDTGCGMLNSWCGNTDLNYSGTVDMADYNILATNWLLP